MPEARPWLFRSGSSSPLASPSPSSPSSSRRSASLATAFALVAFVLVAFVATLGCENGGRRRRGTNRRAPAATSTPPALTDDEPPPPPMPSPARRMEAAAARPPSPPARLPPPPPPLPPPPAPHAAARPRRPVEPAPKSSVCRPGGAGAGEAKGERLAVHGVDARDVLNLRERPDPASGIVGELPPDASGVLGLAERQRVGRSSWRKVRCGALQGWANERFLAPE